MSLITLSMALLGKHFRRIRAMRVCTNVSQMMRICSKDSPANLRSSMSIFTAKTNAPMVSYFHTQGSSVLHLPAGFVVLPKMQWVMLAALLHLADCDLDKREKLHI